MKKDVLSPETPDLAAEACAWLAQLETGRLSREDLAAFREWIERSPRHYAEIRRLAELSLNVNVLATMAGPLKEAADRRGSGVRRTKRARPELWLWPAFGAVVACAAVIAISFSAPVPDSPLSASMHYATLVGQTEEIVLADGSRVKLNTDSRIAVEFDKDRRRVLLQNGEAFFEVQPDPTRPFTVYVGERSVTAVGTAFSVRWINEELVVTVAEGKVAYDEAARPVASISGAGDGRPSAVPVSAKIVPSEMSLLSAGQRLEVSSARPQEVVARLPDAALSRELAWRAGFLDFDDAPLGEVVREMQRYMPEKIEIADQELANLRFGGVFRIGQTEAFLDALELSFGIEVDRPDTETLVLRSVN